MRSGGSPEHQVITEQTETDAVKNAKQPVVVDVVLDEGITAGNGQWHCHGAGAFYPQPVFGFAPGRQKKRYRGVTQLQRTVMKGRHVTKLPVPQLIPVNAVQVDMIEQGIVDRQQHLVIYRRAVAQQEAEPAGI